MSGLLPRDHFSSRRSSGADRHPSLYTFSSDRRDSEDSSSRYRTRTPDGYHVQEPRSRSPYRPTSDHFSTRRSSQAERYQPTLGSPFETPPRISSSRRSSSSRGNPYDDPYYQGSGWGSRASTGGSSYGGPTLRSPFETPRPGTRSSSRSGQHTHRVSDRFASGSNPYDDPYYTGSGWGSQPSARPSSSSSGRQYGESSHSRRPSIFDRGNNLPSRRPYYPDPRTPPTGRYTGYSSGTSDRPWR